MDIGELLLRKEELPILFDSCFEIPIHRNLLDPNRSYDPEAARRVFPATVREWHEDLRTYTEGLEAGKTKEWFEGAFLKDGYEVIEECGEQLALGGCWRDDVRFEENGFASMFSISRNSGGTLYHNSEDMNCGTGYLLKNSSGLGYIRFTPEKALAFGVPSGEDFVDFSIYSQHNIDFYPGALFLRNWAINYMNEVLPDAVD